MALIAIKQKTRTIKLGLMRATKIHRLLHFVMNKSTGTTPPAGKLAAPPAGRRIAAAAAAADAAAADNAAEIADSDGGDADADADADGVAPGDELSNAEMDALLSEYC
jgi:hypothetical protein